MLNHADVIGDKSDAVTQNASLIALCCHLWRDINVNTNRGRVLGKVSCTKSRWESRHIKAGKFCNCHITNFVKSMLNTATMEKPAK